MKCSDCGYEMSNGDCPYCSVVNIRIKPEPIATMPCGSNDLLSRLRKAAHTLRVRHMYMDGHAQLMEDAATEIERLRKEKP